MLQSIVHDKAAVKLQTFTKSKSHHAAHNTGDEERAEWLESHAASLQEVQGLLVGGRALARHGVLTSVAGLKEADTHKAAELMRGLLAHAERCEVLLVLKSA